MTDPATQPPDRWPETRQLIDLAFHPDADVASMAATELCDRLGWPAIPLAHDDGRRLVIRREVLAQ